jgi:DHA1 family multidrug resistance protein-like MFS transporter
VTDSQFVGQVLYNISGRRIFSYPEEKDGFDLPEKYRVQKDKPSRFGEEQEREEGGERERRESDETAVGQSTSRNEDQSKNGKAGEKEGKDGKDGEKDGKDGKEKDETIMVDWYSDDDPENPQNWYVLPALLPKTSATATVVSYR